MSDEAPDCCDIHILAGQEALKLVSDELNAARSHLAAVEAERDKWRQRCLDAQAEVHDQDAHLVTYRKALEALRSNMRVHDCRGAAVMRAIIDTALESPARDNIALAAVAPLPAAPTGPPPCPTCDGWGRIDHMDPKSALCPACTPAAPRDAGKPTHPVTK